MTADPAIEAQGLRKHYGDVEALRGVVLSVATGSVFGLPARTAREDDGRPDPDDAGSA